MNHLMSFGKSTIINWVGGNSKVGKAKDKAKSSSNKNQKIIKSTILIKFKNHNCSFKSIE